MKTEILLAINDKNWELAMGRAISDSEQIKIGRRCVDLTEVLTMIEIGTYPAVLISGELYDLDLAAIEKIKQTGCLVIGVFNENEVDNANFLSGLGLTSILSFFPDNSDVFINNLVFLLNQNSNNEFFSHEKTKVPGLITIWGTEGAPGRTSIAIDLAHYLNKKFHSCLLIDADAQAPAIGASLGIPEEISGLSAAIHLAQKGKLTGESFLDCLNLSREKLSVLTGILKANRWMELKLSGLEKVFETASREFAFQVVDTNATLPDEKDSTYPEFEATLRFGHLIPLLKRAEKVIFVVKATPLGIIRAAELLGNQNYIETNDFSVVVNQMEDINFNQDATNLIYNVLQRFVPKNQIWFHRSDSKAYSQAWLKGTSGFSLMKNEGNLALLFDQLTTTRNPALDLLTASNSKIVA